MFVRFMFVFSLVAVWSMTAASSYGQIRATKVGSADAIQKMEKQQGFIASMKQSKGELNVAGMRVGASGRPEWIDAKVVQVIDANRMLVGIEDARTGKGRYTTWVMVKCPTAGITDGKFWRGGQWKEVTGFDVFSVTGTTTFRTASGGTKTVFVLENPDEANEVRERTKEARAKAEEAKAQAASQRILDEQEKAAANREREKMENDREKKFALMQAEISKLRSEVERKAGTTPNKKAASPKGKQANEEESQISSLVTGNILLVPFSAGNFRVLAA